MPLLPLSCCHVAVPVARMPCPPVDRHFTRCHRHRPARIVADLVFGGPNKKGKFGIHRDVGDRPLGRPVRISKHRAKEITEAWRRVELLL